MSEHEQLVCVLVADMLRQHGFDAVPTPATVEVQLPGQAITITYQQIDALVGGAVTLAEETGGQIPSGRAFAAQIHLVADLLREVEGDVGHVLVGGDR